jgi:hypothetical protein
MPSITSRTFAVRLRRRFAGGKDLAVQNLHRNNGSDLLRLAAATMVLVGHAFC